MNTKQIAEQTAKYLAENLGNRVVRNHTAPVATYDEARAKGWDCWYVSIGLHDRDDNDQLDQQIKDSQKTLLDSLKQSAGEGFLAFAIVPPDAGNTGHTASSGLVSARCQTGFDANGKRAVAIDVFVMASAPNA